MSTAAGRVFSGLTRASFSRGIFKHHDTSTVRLDCVRSLALSAQRAVKSTDEDAEVNNEPVKFSISKASHRTWRVERSMGSQFQQPWWKVLPISLLAISFLAWCVLRGETEVDAQLDKHLFQHLPGFLPDDEKEKNKTS